MSSDRSGVMRRFGFAVIAVALIAAAVVGVTALRSTDDEGQADDESLPVTQVGFAAFDTAILEIDDLVETIQLDAVVVGASSTPIVWRAPEPEVEEPAEDTTDQGSTGEGAPSAASAAVDPATDAPTGGGDGQAGAGQATGGRVTSILDPGSRLTTGVVIAEVNELPLVAIAGTVPVVRTLSEGVDAPDGVRQLEQALVTLGFADDTVTVDDDFTSATAVAVERWQESLGLEPDGIVPAGMLAVVSEGAILDGPLTQGANLADGGLVANTLSPGTFVEAVVPNETLAPEPGTTITLLTETRDRLDLLVLEVAENPDTAEQTLVGVPAGGDWAPRIGQAVDVTWDTLIAQAVLTGPASAVVRNDILGPTVVVVEDGAYASIPVEVTAQSGNRVALSGDGIVAGAEVVSP